MRQPTPENVIYEFWKNALAQGYTCMFEDEVECGFYARRAVKNGPYIPVRIWLEQELDPETGELAADEVIRAEELGCSKDPVAIWTHCRPITQAQYDALVERHRTDAQMQATHVALDLGDTPIRPGGSTHA